jgi:hypothetical protein
MTDPRRLADHWLQHCYGFPLRLGSGRDRELNGAEATGHLLYAHNNKGRAVLLDPQAQRLARLETMNLRALVLARITP